MKESFEVLMSPFEIAGVTSRNRVVMAPMTTLYAGPRGEVTDHLIRYYIARAQGGTGLIVVEAAFVDPQGCQIPGSVAIDSDSCIPGLARLAEAIKHWGAIACLQIIHAGIQAVMPQTVGPSAIGRKIAKPLRTPRALTTQETEQIVEAFGSAAARAKAAGWDMVQIHGTHGYLIQEFLSPLTNLRSDKYGADRELFAEEIVQNARAKCGNDYPIIWRLCADELEPGGITIEDAKQTAKRMQAAGIDAFDVSAGSYDTAFSYVPFMYDIPQEGAFADLARQIKGVVDVPVIGGCGLDTPEAAEKLIAGGKVDMVFVGRALIADPYWTRKIAEGRPEDIRPCIKCTEGCGLRIENLLPMQCNVNPLNGREFIWITDDYIPQAHHKKKVLVVGGGPGGAEFARAAALQGHDVTLAEQGHELGGALAVGAIPPFKWRVGRLVDYYKTQLGKLGVKLEMNTEADTAMLRNIDPDVVVVATGAVPAMPDVRGIENVPCADDVLMGKAAVGADVIVLGAGTVGCELALYLLQQGKKVTIIEARENLLPAGGGFVRLAGQYLLAMKLPMEGVSIHLGSPALEVHDGEVVVGGRLGGASGTAVLKADSIVNACGRQAVVPESLVSEAHTMGRRVYLIGDAKAPRQANDAIYEGFTMAMDL